MISTLTISCFIYVLKSFDCFRLEHKSIPCYSILARESSLLLVFWHKMVCWNTLTVHAQKIYLVILVCWWGINQYVECTVLFKNSFQFCAFWCLTRNVQWFESDKEGRIGRDKRVLLGWQKRVWQKWDEKGETIVWTSKAEVWREKRDKDGAVDGHPWRISFLQ